MAPEMEFKVVESSVVTEDALTSMMNEMARDGWEFESYHFAMREGSHRPAMVFAIFKRAREMQ